MEVDGVFEGGGVKGIGLVGALARLEEEGVRFRRVAGASAGAITAAMYAAGYTSAEMKDLLWRKDFNEFADIRPFLKGGFFGWIRRIWIALPPILRHYGVFSTRPFYLWVKKLLEEKGVRTFSDCTVPLRVFASNITRQELLTFDWEKTPDMEVAEAVRMSMTIPFFFRAHRWRLDGQEALVVDGGVLKNYPIDTFDDNRDCGTVGLKLISEGELEPAPPANNVGSFISRIINTMRVAHEKIHVEEADWARTVPINTGKISTTKFDLTEAEKQFLYESGRKAAEKAIGEGLLQPQGRKGLLRPQPISQA